MACDYCCCTDWVSERSCAAEVIISAVALNSALGREICVENAVGNKRKERQICTLRVSLITHVATLCGFVGDIGEINKMQNE